MFLDFAFFLDCLIFARPWTIDIALTFHFIHFTTKTETKQSPNEMKWNIQSNFFPSIRKSNMTIECLGFERVRMGKRKFILLTTLSLPKHKKWLTQTIFSFSHQQYAAFTFTVMFGIPVKIRSSNVFLRGTIFLTC